MSIRRWILLGASIVGIVAFLLGLLGLRHRYDGISPNDHWYGSPVTRRTASLINLTSQIGATVSLLLIADTGYQIGALLLKSKSVRRRRAGLCPECGRAIDSSDRLAGN